jgi:hypothetical protein
MEQITQSSLLLKKIFIFFILAFISVFNLKSETYFSQERYLRILAGNGISYNFIAKNEYLTRAETFYLELPIIISVDYRIIEWCSINPGLELTYSLRSYQEDAQEGFYSFYIHNLFLRIPVIFKFYPMVYQREAYKNFYIGVGLFVHFWPLNAYYYKDADGRTITGSCYNPYMGHDMPPGNIYTFVNIGLKLSTGNFFPISDSLLFGLELYANYLFIPAVNGYYNNINYSRGGGTILEFNGSVGIMLTFAFNVFSEE